LSWWFLPPGTTAPLAALLLRARGLSRPPTHLRPPSPPHHQNNNKQTNKQQIGESLKRFGIADDTIDVLVAILGPKGVDPESAVAPVAALLEGERAPLRELARLFDAPLAAKLYHVVPAELRVGTLDEAIACRVGGMECL
jgi:hypothetical protein